MKHILCASLVGLFLVGVNSDAQAKSCDCPASFSCNGSYVKWNNCSYSNGCRGSCKCKNSSTGTFDESKTVKCVPTTLSIQNMSQSASTEFSADQESCKDPVVMSTEK